MDDKQLAVLYTVVILLWLGSFAVLHHLLKEPISIDGYADRVCQDLYGPQSGHKWAGDALMCETARGDVLPLKVQ